MNGKERGPGSFPRSVPCKCLGEQSIARPLDSRQGMRRKLCFFLFFTLPLRLRPISRRVLVLEGSLHRSYLQVELEFEFFLSGACAVLLTSLCLFLLSLLFHLEVSSFLLPPLSSVLKSPCHSRQHILCVCVCVCVCVCRRQILLSIKSRHNRGSAVFCFNHFKLPCVDRKFGKSSSLKKEHSGWHLEFFYCLEFFK